MHEPWGIAVEDNLLGAVVGDIGVLPEVGQHPGGGGVALEDGGRRGLQTRVAALVLREGDPAQGCDAVPVALDVASLPLDLGEVWQRGGAQIGRASCRD